MLDLGGTGTLPPRRNPNWNFTVVACAPVAAQDPDFVSRLLLRLPWRPFEKPFVVHILGGAELALAAFRLSRLLLCDA